MTVRDNKNLNRFAKNRRIHSGKIIQFTRCFKDSFFIFLINLLKTPVEQYSSCNKTSPFTVRSVPSSHRTRKLALTYSFRIRYRIRFERLRGMLGKPFYWDYNNSLSIVYRLPSLSSITIKGRTACEPYYHTTMKMLRNSCCSSV